VDIEKGGDFIVFINDIGRGLFIDDFAKNTIVHAESFGEEFSLLYRADKTITGLTQFAKMFRKQRVRAPLAPSVFGLLPLNCVTPI
jgi:hypothetical protein